MKQVFLHVDSAALEHVVLLELIACSRMAVQYDASVNEEAKVSCETNSYHKKPGTSRLPDALPDTIRRVLGDGRAPAFSRDLLTSGALRVFVDAGALQRRCDLIERQWHDEHLLRAFVERQASLPMIRAFFRTATRAAVARLRSGLGVAAPTKPRALSPSDLDALFDAWARLATIDDLRERYLALHVHCQAQWSLATLFAALQPETGKSRGACRPADSSSQEPHHA
ncbi:hypothetical protein KTE44_14500 [Burkholderia multivorans]|nr:hypothetical protein [Burkholderia multivorans]